MFSCVGGSPGLANACGLALSTRGASNDGTLRESVAIAVRRGKAHLRFCRPTMGPTGKTAKCTKTF